VANPASLSGVGVAASVASANVVPSSAGLGVFVRESPHALSESHRRTPTFQEAPADFKVQERDAINILLGLLRTSFC